MVLALLYVDDVGLITPLHELGAMAPLLLLVAQGLYVEGAKKDGDEQAGLVA